MLRSAVIVIVLSGFVWVSAARAEASTIVVEGNHRLGEDSIRAYFSANKGRPWTEEELDAALKAMYRSNQFSDVKVTLVKGTVHVKVGENPVIGRVAFEGNKKLSDKKLEPLMQSKRDGPLARSLIQSDVQNLLEAYRHNGRFNAQITPKIIDTKDGRPNLVFEINEGERIGVSQITFTGNAAFAAATLKDTITTGETNLLSALLGNDTYDTDKIEHDREQLQRYYRSHGYADMLVRSTTPTYDAVRKNFTLTFAIDEGPQYRIRSADVISKTNNLDVARLKPLLLTRAGDVYNADAVDKTVKTISAELAKQAKPFAYASADIQRQPDSKTLDVLYSVEQSEPAYVERIDIRGNMKTHDEVIRRELQFSEGDAYNRTLAEASEARLKKLGYFKTVKISREPGSTPDRTILRVAVEEQNTGTFFVSGGYSNADGWLTDVSVSDSNVLGRGETGKVSVSYAQYSKGFNVAFTEPYLLGHRISLGVDVFGKETTASTYQSFNSTAYGASITVGTPISDTLGLSYKYSLKNLSLTLDPNRGVSSLPIREAAASGPQWISTIGSGVTMDTLNNARNPTNGLRFDVNNDVAGLGGDAKFLRNTDHLRYYHELTNNIVGVTHAQSGYITPWGGKPLPLLEQFFGGPQLVRGFAPNGFGTRDLTPGTSMDNVGGNAYWATSYELQAPVPMLPSSFNLKAAIFADAGSLWSTSAARSSVALSNSLTGNSKTVRSSVGAGLVWDSILGPIRMDYAYPISKANYDVTQRLNFRYGLF